MAKKRLFEILDEMNVHDIDHSTRLVRIGNNLVRTNLTKQGTEVTIGAEGDISEELLSGKTTAVLLLVNSEEFFKRKGGE